MNPFITFTPRNNIQCCIRLAQDFDKNPVVTVQPQPRRRVDRARFKIPTKWDGQKWQQGGEACASRQMWQIRQKGIRESCFQEKTWRFLFGKNYRNTWHYEVSWSGHTFIRRDSCFAWWDSKTFAYRQRLATPQPAWLELQVLELSGSNGQSWKRLQMFCRENLQKSTQNWRPSSGIHAFCWLQTQVRTSKLRDIRALCLCLWFAHGSRPSRAYDPHQGHISGGTNQTHRALVPEASHRFSLQWVLARGDAQVPNGSGRGWLGQIWERLWMWKTNTFWQDAGPQRASKQTME